MALAVLGLAPLASASQAGKELNDADAEMNKAYQAALAKIKDPEQKTQFVAAQRSWLKYRDDSVAFFTAHYPSSKGGLFYNVHLIRERTTFLKALISAPPEDDETGEKASGY